MASNSFGNIFRITTWGESHGKAIGVVIDGCPAGLEISEEEINQELFLRSPGKSRYVSPRNENDRAEIFSGVFEGKTTGAPISIVIFNYDVDSSKYEPIKNLLRPGHASYTYLSKYGIFDFRGGGRASARETACRVAAGAIAKKILAHYSISLIAYIQQIGSVTLYQKQDHFTTLVTNSRKSPIFCPDYEAERQMLSVLENTQLEGDSLGGIVALQSTPLPTCLGDPIYEKLQANLAKAMLSLPAVKGIEFGSGFAGVAMKGSAHNDLFEKNADGAITTTTNHSGGLLGGISSGMPLLLQVGFKPASSIRKPQKTLTQEGGEAELNLPEGSRHDPCVAIRAVPVVEAMTALVLVDAILLHRCARL